MTPHPGPIYVEVSSSDRVARPMFLTSEAKSARSYTAQSDTAPIVVSRTGWVRAGAPCNADATSAANPPMRQSAWGSALLQPGDKG